MAEKKNPWSALDGKKIPATIELDPALYHYISHGDRVLDIGCASGKVSTSLACHGFDVTGLDVNIEALEMTLSSALSHKCLIAPTLIKGTALSLPFANDSFNVAVMQAFLTVVPSKEDRARIIRETCRVLKSGGYLFLADFGQTWHSQVYRERYIDDLPLTKEEGSFLACDAKTGELAYVAHHFTEKELVFLLLENGFEIESFKRDDFVTRTGNLVNGFVVVGKNI